MLAEPQHRAFAGPLELGCYPKHCLFPGGRILIQRMPTFPSSVACSSMRSACDNPSGSRPGIGSTCVGQVEPEQFFIKLHAADLVEVVNLED